jgi:ribbon-helix-helix CopG family protein
MTKDGTQPQTSVTLTKTERRMADQLAKRRGLNRSALIRFLIREKAASEGIL